MLFIFSTPVLIRHLWQLETVVLVHWCLKCVILLLNSKIWLIFIPVCPLSLCQMSLWWVSWHHRCCLKFCQQFHFFVFATKLLKACLWLHSNTNWWFQRSHNICPNDMCWLYYKTYYNCKWQLLVMPQFVAFTINK